MYDAIVREATAHELQATRRYVSYVHPKGAPLVRSHDIDVMCACWDTRYYAYLSAYPDDAIPSNLYASAYR